MGSYAMPRTGGFGTSPGGGFGQAPGSNQYPTGPTMPFLTPGNSNGWGGGGGMTPPGMASPVIGGGGPNPMDASAYNPYQVPPGGITQPGGGPMGYPWGANDPTHAGGSGKPGGSTNMGHGIIATGLQYPGLSQDFANYLMTQIGAGMSPFDLSTMLPTGGMTQPGQLTAGLNPVLSQLMNFFQTGQGGGMPGMTQLGNLATQGVNSLPLWQSMVGAQQQNIAQNQANLKEQFGSMGNLAGSPFGDAMSNYMQQTTLDQNSLLGQLSMQGLLQGQLPAMQSLLGGEQQMAGGLQGLDQQAIQNMYQEFQRTQSQNNPLLQDIMGMSTLYPPTTKTPTTWENINSTLQSLSGAGYSSSSGAGGSL